MPSDAAKGIGTPIVILISIIVVVIVAALAILFTTNTSNQLNIQGEGAVKSLSKSLCGMFGPSQTSSCLSS